MIVRWGVELVVTDGYAARRKYRRKLEPLPCWLSDLVSTASEVGDRRLDALPSNFPRSTSLDGIVAITCHTLLIDGGVSPPTPSTTPA